MTLTHCTPLDEAMSLREVCSARAEQTYTEHMLGGMVAAGAALMALPSHSLVDLCETLLHQPSPDLSATEIRSDLNVNGSPLQMLLSAREGCWGFRLIGDPAFYCGDPILRWQHSRSAIDELLARCQAESMRSPILRFLKIVVPTDSGLLRSYPSGMIRLAASPAGSGLAVYASPPPGPNPSRWARATAWAEEFLPASSPVRQLIHTLERHCILFGMGLEGANPAQSRAKLYWRLRDTLPLAAFGIPWFEADAVKHFLGAVAPSGSLPATALTFSAGFSLGSGELTDAKVDVCISSAQLGLAAALSCINEAAESLDLHPPSLGESQNLFARHRLDIGCVGVGLGRQGRRLNIYLHQS